MMSSTVSIEPSTSPTPSHKMNGIINQRHMNISTLTGSKHGSVITPIPGPTPVHISPNSAGVPSSSGRPSSNGNPMANVTINSNATTKPLLDVSRTSINPGSPILLDTSRKMLQLTKGTTSEDEEDKDRHGIYQMLASLALLCILSLLMSFLALFFLQKLGPMTTVYKSLPLDSDKTSSGTGATLSRKIVVTSEEYVTVYQVSVALSTLTIALDLCCLFVCCIQFLFAIKLLKTPQGDQRTHKFLKKSSYTRVVAIGGFFLSIPVFFTGVILFTFIHFNEVPAIATSVVIGMGIVFCGVASVQNVYLWQWEKTRACRELAQSRLSQLKDSGVLSPEAHATLELSTLV